MAEPRAKKLLNKWLSMAKKLSYFALVDKEKSPGVEKKINNTVLSANECGFSSEAYLFVNNFSGCKAFFSRIIKEKSTYLIIRFSDLVAPLLFFVMLYLRCRGCKIIIDIPTPRSVGLKEMNDVIRSPWIRQLRKLWSILSGSWILWPANKVIQYADDGWWFSLGVKKKTLKIGNGIWIAPDLPLVNPSDKRDGLNLIGVAQLASWHGYDRLIHALAVLRQRYPEKRFQFTIVGDGAEKPVLERLVVDLGLQESVIFTGLLTGAALDKAFEGQHLGVSSLGLYRKGLNEASDLKTREYMARGLCVLGVGRDPDFEADSSFRFVVPNDDSIELLVYRLNSFFEMDLPSPDLVRLFAEENLSLKSKVLAMVGGLDGK